MSKKHNLTKEQLEQLSVSVTFSTLRVYTLLKAVTEDIAFLKEYSSCLNKSLIMPIKHASTDIDYLVNVIEQKFKLKSGLSNDEINEHIEESFNLMDFIENELKEKTNLALNNHLGIMRTE